MPEPQASSLSPQNRIALLCGGDEAATVRELLIGEAVEIVQFTRDDLDLIGEDAAIAAIIVSDEWLSSIQHDESVWSNTPVLLLVDRDEVDDADTLPKLGQLRIVERPLHRAILVAAVRSAIRSRTDAHAMSATLREVEELYKFTIEVSRQVVFTHEPGDRGITYGTRLHELTGTPPDVFLDEVLERYTVPEDRAATLAAWAEAQRAPKPYYAEFRLRLADGSYHRFLIHAVPRFDDEGRFVRWYGFIEDVNEKSKAMDALGEAEERYRLAARATNDAIWDWNLLTDRITWSDAAAAYFGASSLESSGIGLWEDAIHPDDRDRVVRSARRAIEGDKSRWSAAYRLRKADGDHAYVYDRGFIIRDDEGRGIRAVGAVVDLTERRRAESELRRTQAELIHISRVSAMGTMASTLAHELNQPLTAVTSYVRGSRRLLASLDDPAVRQVCEALEFAEAGALRAGQIVRRLREMVARGTVEVQPENLAALIEDASVLAFVDEHLHGITHEIRIEPDARWVEVDRIQIQQVLVNLIRNAVQALQKSETRHVTVSAKAAGEDLVEVSVADTGAGIPPSVRDALFSPFQSTKAEGMGIGLSISRTIVEAHHGRIWAEDAPEGGTVFRFTLPRADVVEDAGDVLDADAGGRETV